MMKTADKVLSLLGIAAILLATAISVNAEEDLFTQLDVNADGLISEMEAEAHDVLYENFEEVDANSDGYVSREELTDSGIG